GYGAGESVSSSDAVHRTVRLSNLDTGTARRIEETASSVGGNAVVSDTGIPGTYPDVSVSATVGEFEEILDRLPEHVASVVEEALGSERSARSSGTKVMGILNVTPDSFYDGGRYNSLEDAVDRGMEIVEEGGDIVDVGGESTRPGADPVGVEEEKERVVPVVDRLSDEVEVPISVDTRHPEVAREALGAGAEIVNDVTGLENPEMRRLVADEGCRVVVMDSVDVPVDTSSEPVYDDVVDDVLRRLSERVLRARRAGVKDEQIVVDPGIGFGKGSDGDVEVLRRVNEFTSLGYPVLVGCSRKSVFGDSLDFSEEERLEPSIAANVLAASKGAGIVRVHDVEETVRAVEVADLLSRPGCREDSSDNDA
ncbi:MAG: dihydropteroate synthase, partial [Halobacteria archaeon]|nr:dihydropteroate synthase [Halobacteria archaeon]